MYNYLLVDLLCVRRAEERLNFEGWSEAHTTGRIAGKVRPLFFGGKIVRGSKAVPQEEKPVRGELLTLSEAAEKIHLSVKWIYKRMESGTLPFPWFMVSPGKRLIDSADIEDWQRLSKIPAGSLPGEI